MIHSVISFVTRNIKKKNAKFPSFFRDSFRNTIAQGIFAVDYLLVLFQDLLPDFSRDFSRKSSRDFSWNSSWNSSGDFYKNPFRYSPFHEVLLGLLQEFLLGLLQKFYRRFIQRLLKQIILEFIWWLLQHFSVDSPILLALWIPELVPEGSSWHFLLAFFHEYLLVFQVLISSGIPAKILLEIHAGFHDEISQAISARPLSRIAQDISPKLFSGIPPCIPPRISSENPNRDPLILS